MPPQIILTFANRSEGMPGFLRQLGRERGEIERALWDATHQQLCGIDVQADVTRAGLIEHLQTAETVKTAVAFHYAGHASGSALALGKGDANADGIAAMLGALSRLHFVFLNGCSTGAQVDALLEAGVPAVIATRADVVDAAATDFAIRFYERLGQGATLRASFDDAVTAVQTKHTVLTLDRKPPPGSSRRRKKTAVAVQVPWQLHSRRGENEADPLEWSLPLAAGDPLFVLPRPVLAVPNAPYRGAEPYRAEDLPIFKGRGHEIRAVYDTLTRGAGQPGSLDQGPVIILRGGAGVGRTSLIQAGLLPRLQVEYAARIVGPETLEEVTVAGLDVVLVDEAERLTDAQVLEALDAAPRVLFAVRSVAADRLTAQVTGAGRIVVPMELTHLNQAAIAQVVGVMTRQFNFKYAADLPKRLAIDLAGYDVATVFSQDAAQGRRFVKLGEASTRAPEPDAEPRTLGATTPITSAVLTGLWDRREGTQLDEELYEAFKRDGHLDAFVQQGIAALADENAEWVESGFALDFLAHHMTLLGQVQGYTIDGLRARYAHRDDISIFIDAACVQRLLVRTPDGTGTLLAHDLLAPLIASRFTRSRAPAQQARRIVEERLPRWANGAEGPTLDASDLLTIEAGRLGMPVLQSDALRMTEASARAVVAKARRRRFLRMALGGALLLLLLLGFMWNQKRIEIRYQDANADLVEAYRRLEDPDPSRVAAGVAQLADLVERHGDLAPPVARLALRAWSVALTDQDEAAARLARPAIVSVSGAAHLVTRDGGFHALEGAPTGWFLLPGGRWVGVLDAQTKTLSLYDVHTGEPAPHGPHTVPGTLEHVAVFDAPNMVVLLSNHQASEPLWQLLILDTRDGRGRSAMFEDIGWRGHCTERIPLQLPPAGEEHVRLAFGEDGRLEPATLTRAESQWVDFGTCRRQRITVLAPRAAAVADLEPAWRRWTAEPLDAAGRRSGLLGGPGAMPVALRNARRPRTGDSGCMEGCGFLAPEFDAGTFAVGDDTVLIDREVCDLDGGSDWLTRWCRTDGRSGYMWSPDAIRSLNADERPPPRRRGDHLLFGGRVLRLSDLVALKTAYAGVAWDFALSPDARRMALLTDRGLLHLVLKAPSDASKQGTYAEHRRIPARHDAFLAAAWISEGVLAVQRRSGVTAIRVLDNAVVWRRTVAATQGGLGVGAGMVAIRVGDTVRLVAAADGTPLSPLERPGMASDVPIMMRIEPNGSLILQDDMRRYTRAPLPESPRTRVSSIDAWLAAQPERIAPLTTDGPCALGRMLRDGECWPIK